MLTPEQTRVVNTLTRRIAPCRICNRFTLARKSWDQVPAELLRRLERFHGLRLRHDRRGLCVQCAYDDDAMSAGEWPEHEIALSPHAGRWVNDKGIQRWVPYRRRPGAATT